MGAWNVSPSLPPLVHNDINPQVLKLVVFLFSSLQALLHPSMSAPVPAPSPALNVSPRQQSLIFLCRQDLAEHEAISAPA